MDPRDFGRAVLRRKASVVTAVVVALAFAFYGSAQKAPVYATSCSLFFQATASDLTENDTKSYNGIGSILDHAKFLRGPEVRARAAKLLKLPVAELGTVVLDVKADPSSNLMSIDAADTAGPTDAQRSSWKKYMSAGDVQSGLRVADVCNAHMKAYIDIQLEQARADYVAKLKSKRRQLAELERQVKEMEARIAAKGGYDAAPFEVNDRNQMIRSAQRVRETIIGLEDLVENGINGGGRIDTLAGPGLNVQNSKNKDLLMGLLMGLIFGVGFAMVREYFDDTVKDKETTQRELGVPVLAALPAVEEFEGYGELSSSTMEAARGLRATLASLGVPHDKSVLLVTSSLAKRRSTALVSLAAALAESGRSVLVLGSDLRGGRTHEAFGIANTVGLANVIRGQVPFEKAIRPAPGMEGVYVLPCGPVIGNPGELLSSEEMAVTLRRAERWADVVLLDAPPVLAAADSSILGAYADGILMVVSAGQTNKARASEAKEQLVSAGGRVLGVVLTDVEDADRGDGEFYGDDLGGMSGWGSYEAGAYDDYYGAEVLTATNPLGPRGTASRPQSRNAAASRAGQRPRSSARTPAVPRNAKTTGRKTTAPRASSSRTTQARKTGAGAKAGTARTNGASKSRTPAARKTTARKPASSTRARTTASGGRKTVRVTVDTPSAKRR